MENKPKVFLPSQGESISTTLKMGWDRIEKQACQKWTQEEDWKRFMVARCLFYGGKVQGVGFRYSVKQLASGYDILGWIRNLPDGRVQLWLQGRVEEVDAMECAILESHLKGFIRETEGKEEKVDLFLKGFDISK